VIKVNTQKKELVSLRIPAKLNKKLTEYLAPIGLSKNAYILSLIYKELKKEESTKNTEHAKD